MIRSHERSNINPEECDKIVQEIHDLTENWPINHWGPFKADHICVLTPHQEQVNLIRQRLRAKKINGVDVHTVRNVQGKCSSRNVIKTCLEFDLLSLVQSFNHVSSFRLCWWSKCSRVLSLIF